MMTAMPRILAPAETLLARVILAAISLPLLLAVLP